MTTCPVRPVPPVGRTVFPNRLKRTDHRMKIALITAGAAGMYCGSCMHDNTLAAAMIQLGHETLLVPTFTPIRSDEEDVSQQRVFFGGINVYLQQKSFLFRMTPWFVDRLLDFPKLLRWVSRFASRTPYHEMGDLTLSMLEGTHGKQRKEVSKMVDWLENDIRPDVLIFSNVLLSGVIPEIKSRLNKPILATLQGDDIFLDALPESYRSRCMSQIRENAKSIDGYITTSDYYADFMAEYMNLPREAMHTIYPGLKLTGHGAEQPFRAEPPYTVGYFARICPEKGFHQFVDAFLAYSGLPDAPPCRIRVSGWLGEQYRAFFQEQMAKLAAAGLSDRVEYVESPTLADKVRFMQSLDILSVPTEYREPKGLYILEALANGVPVVQPGHGSFPELVARTGGGLTVEPNQPQALARGWQTLLADPDRRRACAEQGKRIVWDYFTDRRMAEETLAMLERYLPQSSPATVGASAD
ncbi:glycosyltransferase family 4 protein [Tuwongella immobilis]|uniref:Glycosyl transferase family 1 domain-containing protein n=1 Tax=Tuwongella immobilis TaxID=692036 RepID=A0A6C2YLU1_9BACT|nr:glycosyltransferase family 4 protein [Tuwongella immobilis]VIP02396.1 Hexosyltransferase OS=uncultured planctomycete GN=HGMM_F11G08C15 PE=4 SV=1: Glycos_transf_1 [Tuwongella immobilis]VTS01274.1 Hexosyltransferase OS=uncultured planctomycete GN=HGMM_F11G08C15 PE=4 SV=1: Glycos_transf_1 [Tuwongella immobilis]